MTESIYSTKYQLAMALRKRLETTPLDKITVRELAADCGVNRQTFYYHFEDIYDLMHWSIELEARSLLEMGDEFDWKICVRRLINYIDQNHALCMSILDSLGHRMLRRIIAKDIEELIRKVADSVYGGHDEATSEAAEFNIKFYSLAVGGLLESWVLGEISIPTEKLISHIEGIITTAHVSIKKSR